MNKEEIQAIERCENFSINVLVEHPDIYGSRWLVQEDIKSIKAVKTLLRLYRQLQQENNQLKDYIKELEENSVVLVSQVESWSKTADIYLEKYQELHNKIDKCLEYLEDKNNSEWIKIDKLLQVLKDSDVDE